MKYRKLGSSDLNASEIILGSWLTYGGGVERQNAEACIHKAFDVGINFIDTANVYARGAAESLLGEVLQGVDRASYILATKVYFPMSDVDRGLSAAQIHKQIDASLQRLKTDYVDLYQCHRYDTNTPLEETMEALTEVVRQGKARYIGFSEWNPSQIQAALNLPNVEKFVSSQPQYSMLWRKPEAEVFPLCAANGIGQIVWSPLAQGVLTGKYKPGEAIPKDSRAANDQMNGFMNDLLNDRILTAVQDLKPIAGELNISMAQLALAWVLRDERVTGAIIGASRPEQIVDNAAASEVTLSEAELKEIDRILEPALSSALSH
ncbi:aldo/keto reductase family protein [Leptolyngbya sp. NIES-2104]|uniref:aldo/keto reductase family protein n=1 Tax=Leptolyngbya sp. NIES-2104 TaxID=1552121 RepID=UPI0006EC83B2|nr:aldo/keto reductase family protein [Leptolyngbya sp. NIES-2104]GAP94660.1 potassium channel beta chain [Leptolyngbya sp. NIES-2104]